MSQRKLARAAKVTQVALALTLAGCASGGVLDITLPLQPRMPTAAR
jgi:hypothetical protein